MASHGQIFSHKKQPMHLGWSMMHVAFKPGCSGPGSLSMQSTGHTATHTSQPVQLSGLMSAFGRPLRGAGAAAMRVRAHSLFEAGRDELAHYFAVRDPAGLAHDVLHDLPLVGADRLEGFVDQPTQGLV